ncbi:hypothetical protein [Ramlibacter sp.]|uniref:hypothetical protein n=1 Tax=Ramlibacter sp. TaxID=1917967 RepID=UPI002FCA9AEC
MSFPDLVRRFEQAPSATDSFKFFYRESFELMNSDPENAALLFIVGSIAKAFVRKYEDQELSPEFVDAAKRLMLRMSHKALHAMADTPAVRLRAAGEIATEYEWKITSF